MRVFRVLAGVLLVAGVLGCQQAQQPQQPPARVATSVAFEPKPHGTLAQVMRGIPFPNSNIIFDTQTKDPAAADKDKKVDKSSTAAKTDAANEMCPFVQGCSPRPETDAVGGDWAAAAAIA